MNDTLDKAIELTRDIRNMEKYLERANEEEKNAVHEGGRNAAMLADISEIIFGGSQNDEWMKIRVPRWLSYAHAGWACGPGRKPKGQSYFDQVKGLTSEEYSEWNIFLVRLESVMNSLKEAKEA